MRASDDQLRGAGLSRAKFLSLRDLARRVADGELPTLAEARRLEDDALVERLTRVRGIGRWTVEMLLIFRLGRVPHGGQLVPLARGGARGGSSSAARVRTSHAA